MRESARQTLLERASAAPVNGEEEFTLRICANGDRSEQTFRTSTLPEVS